MGIGTRGRGSRFGGRAARAAGLVTATLSGSLALAVVVPAANTVLAASITVTATADGIDASPNCPSVSIASLPGPGGQTTLREAICAANNNPGSDTITFSVNGTFTLAGAANEDNGSTGDLDVKSSVQINGNGTANTIIDGAGIERIFDVFPSSSITFGLSNLTVQHGDTRTTSFKEGGAIYLHNNVTSTLSSVTVKDNFSGANGAIENRGTLTVTNSVISGNQTIPSSGNVVGGGMRNAGTLTITGTTFANNLVRGEGGALATTTGNGVTVSISTTTFSGNSAVVTGGGNGQGGAISTTGNDGTIILTNVTLSGNRADHNGGALYATSSGPGPDTGNVTLNNVTVTNNTADNDNNGAGAGGGIARSSGSVTLRNTIVAGNFNSTTATRDDVSGAIVGSSANTLIGDGTGSSGVTNGVNSNQIGSGASPINPLLGTLASNGGATQTHALQPGSPAINTGNNATCASTDQRGVARPGGATCDIGAYELNDTTPPDTTITGNPTNPTNSATGTFTFTGSDTGGSGLASFQCQLDGGGFSACTSSKTYTSLANGSHTFQVRAVDGQGNIDPTPASFTWLVDATAPDTSITTTPPNPSGSSSATFTFGGIDSGSGVSSFQCQLDGGGFSSCTSPQTYSGLADGSHTFSVRAIDNAGNVDPTPAAYAWVVDSVAPDTSITAHPANATTNTSAAFSFTGVDGAGSGVSSFQCRLDGGSFGPCTSPQTYLGLADGSHTFSVRAVDNAGNVDPTPATFTWSVDATGPDTAITAHPTDPTASSSAGFSFNGTDAGSGVADFECRLDGGSFAPCASGLVLAGLSDGPHTFEARAIDALGNVDPTPASFSWTVDTTAPVASITTGPSDPSASSGASFTFSGADSGTGVASFECSLDGSAFTACSSPQTLASLSDGSHTFDVRAIDAVGNVSVTPASFTWVVDTTAPDTNITGSSVSSNPTSDTNASLAFTGTDSGTGVASFECSLDGAAFGPCSSPAGYASLVDGPHTFEVRAVDAAGNVDPTPASSTWTVDTGAPGTTITAQPADPSTSSSASFSFTGDDAGGSGVASFECQLDGGGFTTCTSPEGYSSLSDGSHTFEVRAVDGAGTPDPTPATYTWLVDTTAPDTTITAQPANPSDSAGASFGFAGADGGSGLASFECRLDGGGFTACTSPEAFVGLADGSHTFQVRAIDAAGNVDPTPASRTWLVDTTAPDTAITAQPADPSASAAASFSFTGSDTGGSGVASFECQLDGGGFTACASPEALAGLADGSHTFQVRAVDAAGNVDPTPASRTWLVDTTAPDTAITAQPANPSASAAASFSFTGSDVGSGVASFECRLDGAAFAACTSPQAFAGLADGSHTFQVRAIDAVGNVDPTPAAVTWTIDTVIPDTTAPDTTLTTTPPNPSPSAGASFAFTGSDTGGSGVASFQCSLDGATFTTCTTPQAFLGLADGSHTFQVRAVDGAGNVDPTPATATWTIDTSGPETTITASPGASSGTSTSFAFSGSDGTGSGVVSFECRLDGAAFAPCTSPIGLNGLTAGSHTFQVRAVDAVANVDATPASVTWTVVEVASEAPTTTIAPSVGSGGSLPATGSNTVPWLEYALVAIGCGVLLLTLRGRRRRA